MILGRLPVQRLLTVGSSCQSFSDNILFNQIRTKVIYYLPYPTETKRVRKQGFKKKVSAQTSRKDMMTRILRGEKVIAQ